MSNEKDCQGHPAGPFDPMGETSYCDGSCRDAMRENDEQTRDAEDRPAIEATEAAAESEARTRAAEDKAMGED